MKLVTKTEGVLPLAKSESFSGQSSAKDNICLDKTTCGPLEKWTPSLMYRRRNSEISCQLISSKHLSSDSKSNRLGADKELGQ